MTATRTLGIAFATLAGFIVGGYLGLYLLLSLIGLGASGFELWAIGIGSILGCAGGLVASPDTATVRGPMLGTTLVIGVAATVLTAIVDGGPEWALGAGIVLAIALTITAALPARENR